MHRVRKNNEFALTKKIFRQINVLVISLVKHCFYETFRQQTFHNFHPMEMTTVWKLRKFTATILSQKFREIIFLLKKFTLNCFDEKKFAWQ